jgi:hypothetical protein
MRRLVAPYPARTWQARQRRWGRACPAVEPSAFVNLARARELLGLRSRAGARSLLTRGVLEPCVCGDLDDADSYGATLSSVERERDRRRTASLSERVGWRIRAMLHYL